MRNIFDWDQLDHWLHTAISGSTSRLIKSVLFVLLLFFVRALIIHGLSLNKNMSTDNKRYWSVNLRNSLFLLALVGMIIIWSRTLAAFAISLVAVAAAFVIATKELIMCLLGSFFRAVVNSYSLGDLIELGPYRETGPYRGIVIDITMLSTTIMEIGPDSFVNQHSGRVISLPHSLLLEYPLVKGHTMGQYIAHAITIPIENQISAERVSMVLTNIAKEICAPFFTDAYHHISRNEKRRFIGIPSAKPSIAIFPVDAKHYKCVLRIVVPFNRLYTIEQEILRSFMAVIYGPDKDQIATKSDTEANLDSTFLSDIPSERSD